MTPVLLGSLVTGVAFLGIALASQRTATSPPSESGAEIVLAPRETPALAAAPVTGGVEHPTGPKVLSSSMPVALDIASIDVHSDLHRVGLDSAGAIETPSGALYDQAAWYDRSPTPGSLGPAIIVGHVDSAANGPSVFFRLGELERGDAISVTRADRSVARFEVDAVRRLAKDDFPTELVYGDLDHAGLRLITCGGDFDEVAGHYRDNVVVFATLQPRSST